MPDREKVIKELEGLQDICNAKSNMAIGKGKIAWAGHANAVDDALALLKEQAAQSVLSNRVCEVEPFRYVRKGFCPKCHQEVEWLLNRKYCGFCGQAVKWK